MKDLLPEMTEAVCIGVFSLLKKDQKSEPSFLLTDLAGSAAVMPAFAAATDAYEP